MDLRRVFSRFRSGIERRKVLSLEGLNPLAPWALVFHRLYHQCLGAPVIGLHLSHLTR